MSLETINTLFQGRLDMGQAKPNVYSQLFTLLRSNNEGSDIRGVHSIRSGHLFKQIKYITHLIIGIQLTLLYSSLWCNLNSEVWIALNVHCF